MSFGSARWFALCGIAAVIAAGTGVASCSSAREAIGFSSQPLTFGGVVDFATLGQETTACWTQRPFDDVLCAGLNTNSWAWSTDKGANWTVCGAGNPASCNGAFGPYVVPDAGPLAGLSLAGDPTVVADKKGNVVQVLMAGTGGCSTGTEGVVAIVSHDAGQTFDWSTATLVNDNGCSNGCQDQPDATFDYSTNPPTLWIAFRHAGIGHYGACARRYFINASGALQPIDAAYAVDTASGSVSGHGIGAIRVRAGGGVTTG